MIGNDCVNHSVSDRDCSHCIWHTDGRCASWDCEYISRKEALEALEKVKNEAPMELPPEQSTHSNTPNTLEALDCIDRQAAIDALVKAIRNDPCYDSNERINGLGVCDVRVIINDLPSAQPDIIRCEDCKWYGRADKRRFYRGMDCLQKRIDTIVPDRDFCSRAERRTDESN